MANYIVTDTELTSIANAIRTKGGTSASLTYPDGFISAISAISGSSATQHTIHLEFTDETTTDINVYYNDTIINSIITNYHPNTWTYNNKTVDTASLDNTQWYTRINGTWTTLWNNNQTSYYADSPYAYCWITELGDVEIVLNSIWRITFDNEEYILTAMQIIIDGNTIVGLGNPVYGGGSDNNSEIPFSFYNSGYGAWAGGVDGDGSATSHAVKIERLDPISE